jgi:hypothetical protein
MLPARDSRMEWTLRLVEMGMAEAKLLLAQFSSSLSPSRANAHATFRPDCDSSAGGAGERLAAAALGGQQHDRARQTCFCGLLRSVTLALRARRSVSVRSIVAALRIRLTRTDKYPGES